MKTSPKLQRIITEIGRKHGVDFTRPEAWLRLDMPGFDRLSIENIGLNRVSVAHYYKQNGDLCPAPDVEVFIGYREWVPIALQDQFGRYIEAAILEDNGRGIKSFYPKQQKEIASFCETWAKNIRDQGWLDRATVTSREVGEPVVKYRVNVEEIHRN